MNAFKFIMIIVLPVMVSGCAGMGDLSMPSTPTAKMPGLYHKIRPKETLWRVSKMYGVDLQTLAKANNLTDAQKIYAGQLLFIPQANVTDFDENAKERSFVWPIKGKVLSFYGSIKDGVKNKGIDINARHGEAVIAARSGKVSFIDENMKGFGKTLIIDHADEYSTVYAYNSQILVKVGQSVRQGTVIAKAGQSGRASSSKLHFEIRKRHEPQNPFYFLP